MYERETKTEKERKRLLNICICLAFWQKIGTHSCKKEREKQNARERVSMKERQRQ